MRKITESFSMRLSLYIIGVTGLLFVVSFYIYFTSVKHAITSEAYKRSQSELSDITRRIDAAFALAEQSIETSIAQVQHDLDNPEAMENHIINVIASNPVIAGSCVAFEPWFYPQKGKYYMPYAYRDEESIKAEVLGGYDYDYFSMEWFEKPKALGHGYWCEPYFDKGGGNMIMVTYTQLLRNKENKIVGVMTADISLTWLSKLVLDMKPYPNSYAFMLSHSGYYLVHKNKERILNETYFAATRNMTDSTVYSIGKAMIDLQTGNEVFNNDDTLSYVFYMPIERTGWSVALVSSQEDVLSELNSVTRRIWLIVAVGLVLIFIFAALTINRITAPLKLFAYSAGIIAKGNFNAPLPEIRSRDEMYMLRQAFFNMQHSLKQYIAELKETTATKERIESELSIARDIQMGMVPKVFPAFPYRSDVDIFAVLTPAKEVGGDLYDFFIEVDNLFFVIGDVSGKGIPASLLMVVARSLFRSTASHTANPVEIVSAMNSAVAENNDAGMFITLFVGILNLKTGIMRYCNAGHNPPVILSSGEPTHFMDVVANIPIGVFDGYTYRGEERVIHNGENIFLYTDGLTEAENEKQELYSEKRLLENLHNMANLESAQTIVEVVVNSVAGHVNDNEQSDDLTILVIHYKS